VIWLFVANQWLLCIAARRVTQGRIDLQGQKMQVSQAAVPEKSLN
jgi:hypothetical protein